MYEAPVQKPWWWKKRVWLIALSGWMVALINCAAFLVVSVSDSASPGDSVSQAATCEEVFLWQLYALEIGDLRTMGQANQRSLELRC